MVLTKEYRICMPLTVEEYRVGQLYMIARHSLEQSYDGEGVETVENKECEDPVHGKGQFTEKRIHLSWYVLHVFFWNSRKMLTEIYLFSRLPYWIQAVCPKVFYLTEKAWNYYPFTITEYTCSFVPKFHINIQTRYENNNGSTENCLDVPIEKLSERTVDHLDIAFDDLSNNKHYKEEEDPKKFKSKRTGRGPLIEGWRDDKPIMCSYKLVSAFFEVWGFQTRVEDFIQKCIREVLLLGHRQAFAWIDSWYDMTIEDVRAYEKQAQAETNSKVVPNDGSPTNVNDELENDTFEDCIDDDEVEEAKEFDCSK
ncbi:Cytoplasmic phosphatidylinositol transfer protein 1 [Pseudolycoriella hygida]|uniref:Cytoplasmic phosphatidylinositol transfer protein 1 n=1 Tax=Pseudolycoriella hygida TaxID=35572 RepID=A0A9Q0NH45_9DIPT|nr:Cytoplasmic phosphatidylinositol transfer protein 1 [Pseudolycoriella hygida]